MIENALIDTNIIIHLEDDKVIDAKLANALSLGRKNGVHFLFHEECLLADIDNDKNQARKAKIISKAMKYERLENPLDPSPEFCDVFPKKKKNDEIDNHQLYQVFRNRVDIFITEDRGIKSKAKVLGLEERVLHVNEAIALLGKEFEVTIPRHPVLYVGPVSQIEKYFKSDFFESLRNDYPNLDKWLQKCVGNNRQCYWWEGDGRLGALLIYKEREQYKEHLLSKIPGDVLKICTFKVADDATGHRLGQTLLDLILKYAIEKKLEYVYLTVRRESKNELLPLRDLLTQFGFTKNNFDSEENAADLAYVKKLNKNQLPQEEIEKNSFAIHPFYRDFGNNKYIIPIKPTYHNRLFKDSLRRNPQLFDAGQSSLEEAEGNSIDKTYICRDRDFGIASGDIIFFYVTSPVKAIESAGVLILSKSVSTLDELLKATKKSTVYDPIELKKLLAKHGSVRIYRFRSLGSTKKPIPLRVLRGLNCSRSNFQSFPKISENEYNGFKGGDYFDQRYIIDKT